eukprot:scaffold815_cov120-Cylindrotheca_fusiformis.AAC.1
MKFCSVTTSSLLILAAFATVSTSATDLLDNGNTAFDEFEATYGSDYDHTHCLGSSPGGGSDVCIMWKINKEQEQIELAVLAGASGWVGFGLSIAGGMPGGDMMIFEAKTPEIVSDYTSVAYARPTLDACASDWKMKGSSVVKDGFLAVRVTRALDTNDSQDLPFVDDEDIYGTPSTAIIAAWGNDKETGLSYHGSNVARSTVRFFEDSSTTVSAVEAVPTASDTKAMLEDMSDGSIMIFDTDYPIPTAETTYYAPCFNASDYFTAEQMEKGVYLIGAEYLSSAEAGGNDNTVHLHHMVATVGFTTCASTEPTSGGQDLIYSWAPGTHPLAFPPNAGIRVGGGNGVMSFGMNIHYDNPNGIDGLLDSTGNRWYYVNDPREHEVGQLTVGDAIVALRGVSVGAGQTGHDFTCPGTCSEKLFDGPVTVFSEGLHLHETGVRIVNELVRNGEVVNRATVDYFDFRQNGINAIRQKPYTVYPGDSFRTRCYYENNDNSTTFGLGTREEMCQSLLMYYPSNRKNGRGYCAPKDYLGACTASYDGMFVSDGSFDRLYGVPPEKCPVTDNEPDSESGHVTKSLTVALVSVFSLAFAMVM